MRRRHVNERLFASAVDWSGDEAAMSLIGSPTDGSFIVTHTPEGSKQLLRQQTFTALILVKIEVSVFVLFTRCCFLRRLRGLQRQRARGGDD